MTDADLQRALGRREPSAGFAERVLERVRSEGARPADRRLHASSPVRRERAWIAAGLALAASIFVATGILHVEYARREAGAQRAAADLEVALRITTEKLQQVQVKVTNVTHIGVER